MEFDKKIESISNTFIEKLKSGVTLPLIDQVEIKKKEIQSEIDALPTNNTSLRIVKDSELVRLGLTDILNDLERVLLSLRKAPKDFSNIFDSQNFINANEK